MKKITFILAVLLVFSQNQTVNKSLMWNTLRNQEKSIFLVSYLAGQLEICKTIKGSGMCSHEKLENEIAAIEDLFEIVNQYSDGEIKKVFFEWITIFYQDPSNAQKPIEDAIWWAQKRVTAHEILNQAKERVR